MHPNELSNSALDYAVAVAQGEDIRCDPMGFSSYSPTPSQAGFWVWYDRREDGQCNLIGSGYSPSTDGNLGGNIINTHRISTIAPSADNPNWTTSDPQITGETYLIAAMRCYVAQTLGYEISLPDLSLNDQEIRR
ncbi:MULTISPECIES: phage protein NinX family protein [Vibrio]|uniref:DUF2591 domain-containing protein n=2 Tax=Vibrio TaxID=662 RepID=A0A510IJ43_9VIBR|nr:MULTISPECIES: phage protein NinX family protein [Vibrio]RTZ20317.1 DUF2591 domain-containing protein [Vibrio penaeicida]BBL92240.1 hypothetical protein VroAM7_48930 [Vibrio rotiferianus]GLQ71145.1 hypothetical protein GCM10007932_05050 [Vibrio penaeicida]